MENYYEKRIIMKIGVIGAMDVEVASLIQHMSISRIVEKAGMKFHEGTINKTDVVIVQSGIAKVNAGICVQILVDLFDVTHIINTGVAGSLNNAINVGDVVISKDAMYHDVDATVFGYAPGQVPQMKVTAFPADEKLRAAAAAACKKAAPEIGIFEGRVVSGDQFICEHDRKVQIREKFDALCCEMEGAAIAQASWLNSIPFVIIRAISDKADEETTVSYNDFEAKAAEHCANLVLTLLRDLRDI